MAHRGYELFMPSPDAVSEMKCKVCGSICDVKRGVYGPTSWAGAMAKKGRLHDLFTCPNSKEEWHIQALNLLQEMEKSFSPSLKEIMQNDLDYIVKTGKDNA